MWATTPFAASAREPLLLLLPPPPRLRNDRRGSEDGGGDDDDDLEALACATSATSAGPVSRSTASSCSDAASCGASDGVRRESATPASSSSTPKPRDPPRRAPCSAPPTPPSPSLLPALPTSARPAGGALTRPSVAVVAAALAATCVTLALVASLGCAHGLGSTTRAVRFALSDAAYRFRDALRSGEAPPPWRAGRRPGRANGTMRVTFQAHSANDLAEWPALYRKGARSFKVDPHYVPSTRYPFTQGALLLSHDVPDVDRRNNTAACYDDLDDVLEELSPRGATGRLAIADGARLRVQLCFKSAPEPCERADWLRRNATAQEWIQLVDAFHARAALRAGELAHVEFVLDGGAKPARCLREHWLPWRSVWFMGDHGSPPDALLDEEPPYLKRYAQINNPAVMPEWERLRAVRYGRFNALAYPIQLWEPSDQATIRKFVDWFREGPAHAAGFSFVSNMDPAMTAAYSNGLGAFNEPMVQGKDVQCPLGVHVFPDGRVAVGFSSSSAETDDSVFRAAAARRPDGTAFDVRNAPFKAEWTRMTGSYDASSAAFVDEVSAAFMVAVARGEPQPGDAPDDVDLGGLRVALHGSLHEHRPSADHRLLGVRVTRLDASGTTSFLGVWVRRAPSGSGPLQSGDGGRKGCPTGLLVVQYVARADAAAAGAPNATARVSRSTARAPLCVALDGGAEAADGDVAGLEDGALLVAVADGRGGVQVAIKDSWWSPALRAAVAVEESDAAGGDDVMSFARARFFTVGAHPRLASSGGVTALLATDGFCFNSDDANKRSAPKVCDAEPVSTSGVITYTVGTTAEWRADLASRAGKAKRGALITACNANLLHGALDSGSCPVVAVATTASGERSEPVEGLARSRARAELVVAYLAPPSAKAGDAPADRRCGSPAWRDALVRTHVPLHVVDVPREESAYPAWWPLARPADRRVRLFPEAAL